MEPQTASVYSSSSVPRLRVTRRPSSTASTGLPPVQWATDPKRSSSYSDSQATSEDESGTLSLTEVTPRLLSASLPPPDSTTVSGDTVQRLRAVLDRFETSHPSRAPTSHSQMPPSPSEPESDFDVPPAQAARASIKLLLQNALREPGDTPQKPKLTRRASFNAVGSPKISKSRRKSTSDEENDSLAKSHENRRFDPSIAASFDRLRLQLNDSMSLIQATSFDSVISHPSSQANASTATKAPSSHYVRDSRTPVVKSPIKRIRSHKDLEPFATASVSQLLAQHNNSNHTPNAHTHEPSSHLSPANDFANITDHHDHDAVTASRANPTLSDADHLRPRAFQQETDIERDPDWNRRHPPHQPSRARISNGHFSSTNIDAGRASPGPRPAPPEPGASRIRSPKHSLTRREDELSDGHSSRGTSASSNAEHRDRQKESEQERQHVLERNWNRPHQQNYKSAPLRVQDPPAQGHSPPVRPANEHLHPYSRVGHDFARSPSPSASVPNDEKLETQHEIEHERERNWNAPRPKWGQHSHHSSEMDHPHHAQASSLSPSHIIGTDKDQTTVHGRHSTSSLTPVNFSEQENSHSRPHSRLQHVNNDRENLLGGNPLSQTSSHSRLEDDIEGLHERERNRNAPRPSWHQHTHHQTSGHETGHGHHPSSQISSHTSPRSDKEREQGWGRHRPNSSLEVPVHRHSTRSPSPTPLYRPRPSSRHNSSRAKSPAPTAHALEEPQHGTNSSPPHFDGERGKEAESEPGDRKDWDSPQNSPLQTLSKTERTESTHSNPISMLSAHRSPHDEIVHQPAPQTLVSTVELVVDTDIKKGHRRTFTQLSEAMGPFPRKTALHSSIAKSEESDGSLFANESVPPPRTSTPTHRSSHMPDLSISPAASDIPLPPSPPSPIILCDTPVRADSDLARLQRAVAPNFTFPARPPSPPQPLPLSTPRPPSSFNAQKKEFKTPSPPLGLPNLPEPTSSDDAAKTSNKMNGHVDPQATSLSLMKTPRFPGAFGTPDPPASNPIVGHTMEGDISMSWKEVETTAKLTPVDAAPLFQPQSVENGSLGSTPMPVTPAPPGAYRATPAQSKPKGILKVRFDGDVQSSGLVTGTGGTMNGVVSTTRVISPPPSPSSEDVPLLSLSPSRRKGLRLVDEYGRARRFTQDGEEIILDSRRKANEAIEGSDDISESKSHQAADGTMTARRRTKMRQVDAIGNDIAAAQSQPNGEVHQIKPGRKATFLRLTRSLGDLKHSLAEEGEALAASVPQGSLRDDERLMDLALVSKTARVERNKLSRRLQLERHAESGIGDTVYIAHSPTLSPSETLIRVSWWRRRWRILLFLLILELVVLCVGYRLASIHAKQAWLVTHYDPFFPALYLRKTPPSFISRFGTLPMDWSAFAISGAVQRVGVRGFVEGVVKQLWEGIWSWRMGPWEGAWGSPATAPAATRAWPPS